MHLTCDRHQDQEVREGSLPVKCPHLLASERVIDTVAMDQITENFLTDVADIEGGVMCGLDNIGSHHNADIETRLVAADVPVYTSSPL